MIHWGIRTGLLLILIFGTAVAASPTLSESEKRVVEGLGILPQVEALPAQDWIRLKQIIKDKPAAEVKSFVVTRSFIRMLKTSGIRNLPKLTSDQELTIKENIDIGYCNDFNEQLDAMNGLLFYGIEPVRGVEAGKFK